MFAQALRSKTNRGRVAKYASLPAPTRGWFVAQNLAAAPSGTAFRLDNWFPASDFVRLRGGSTQFAAGIQSEVRTLMAYKSGTDEKLFAANPDSIYDVTAGGLIGSPEVTGLGSGDWQHVNFTTTGDTYIVAVNGVDDRQLYDGTSWSTSPGITGVSGSSLVNVWVYKSRLYFIQKYSMSAWYLDVDSVGGTATQISLGGEFPLGGYLVAGATWSVATNAGLQDVCVFVSSEGEVVAFSGGYPGATDWTKVGAYTIGRPMGYRCLFRAGGDVAVLCEDGIIPLSKAVNYDKAAIIDTAITKPIAPEFQRTTKTRSTLFGWQMQSWPAQQMFIVNVPQLSTQYVSNLITGAWCRFTGWDASCWAVFQNRAFFGTREGTIHEADVGAADVGENTEIVSTTGSLWDASQWDSAIWNDTGVIGNLASSDKPYTATMFWNYSDLKVPAVMKMPGVARVNAQATTALEGTALTMRYDYDFTIPALPPETPIEVTGALWDVAVWDVDQWPAETSFISNRWVGVSGIGTMVAPVYQVTVGSSETIELKVTSVDMTFEPGEAFG